MTVSTYLLGVIKGATGSYAWGLSPLILLTSVGAAMCCCWAVGASWHKSVDRQRDRLCAREVRFRLARRRLRGRIDTAPPGIHAIGV